MAKKPNVIVMLADDLGIGDLSCFNPDSRLHTENLDRLAAEGMRCTDAHASSALCTPSRYGLMTGRYNWRSALKQVVIMGYTRHLIEDGRATLGTLFRDAGYRTAVVGKWHLGLDWAIVGDDAVYQPGAPMALDQAVPEVDYTQPVQNGPDVFGFDYSYITPGSLDIAPYAFLENGRVTAPPLGTTGNPEFYSTGPRGTVTSPSDPRIYTWPAGAISADYVHEHVVPDSAERVLRLIDDYAGGEQPFFLYYPVHAPHLPCLPTPEFAGKSPIGPYGDMVLMLDDIVGRIMDKLEEKGIADDTIFVFTSDNGSENSYPTLGHEPSYRYRGHKSDIWDGGHRIPFIVRWPGRVSPGSTADQTVCLCDLFATFADVLGHPVADNEAEDSVSLLPVWEGTTEPVRTCTVHSSGMGMFAIRKGRWKLEMCPGAGGFVPADPDAPPIQLYDMDEDVGETTNVADANPDVVAELTALLTACVRNGRTTSGAPQKNTGPEWWPQLNWMPRPEA